MSKFHCSITFCLGHKTTLLFFSLKGSCTKEPFVHCFALKSAGLDWSKRFKQLPDQLFQKEWFNLGCTAKAWKNSKHCISLSDLVKVRKRERKREIRNKHRPAGFKPTTFWSRGIQSTAVLKTITHAKQISTSFQLVGNEFNREMLIYLQEHLILLEINNNAYWAGTQPHT